MKILLKTKVGPWILTGFLGKQSRWFFGFSKQGLSRTDFFKSRILKTCADNGLELDQEVLEDYLKLVELPLDLEKAVVSVARYKQARPEQPDVVILVEFPLFKIELIGNHLVNILKPYECKITIDQLLRNYEMYAY